MEITEKLAINVLATVNEGLCSGLGVPELGKMCVEAAVCYALGLPHGDDPSCVSRALRSFKINLNDAPWSSNEARAKGLGRLALIQLGSAGHLDDMEFARRVAELAIRKAVPAALRSAAAIQKCSKHKVRLLDHALICEREGTWDAAMDAKAAAASAANASDLATFAASAAANAASSATFAAFAAANAASAAAAATAISSTADSAASAAAAATAISSTADSADHAGDKLLSDFAEGVVQVLIEMKVPGAQWLRLAPLEVPK